MILLTDMRVSGAALGGSITSVRSKNPRPR